MKISVALCTYNGEKYLKQQIDSILNQTTPVHEIIVCDDCSTDATKTILEDYQIKFPDVFKLYFNDINLRSNKNFEKAIDLTTGDYIFLSDQDDLWMPEKVEKTLQVFKENPTAEGVFSNANLIDDKNNFLFDNKISLWDSVYFFENKIPKPIDLYRILVLKGNFLTGATFCIKKEVKEFCFPFKTLDKDFLHDEWFAYILSERNTLFYSTEKLISYRIHNNQQIGVGEIQKNIDKVKKMPKNLELILGIYQPKSFNDFKSLTRVYFRQYEKYLNLSGNNPNFKTHKITEKLLNLYLEADANMKKTNPVFYFFRKLKDKQKGKRQL